MESGTDDRGGVWKPSRGIKNSSPNIPIGKKPSKKCRKKRTASTAVRSRTILACWKFRAGDSGQRTGHGAHRIAPIAPHQGPTARGLARHPLGLRLDAESPRRTRLVWRRHALQQFAKSGPGHEQLLRQFARGFPVFSELLRNVELGMAKADLGIARDYSGLVRNAALRKRVFSMLEEEFCARVA